jgi:hypothetical protein
VVICRNFSKTNDGRFFGPFFAGSLGFKSAFSFSHGFRLKAAISPAERRTNQQLKLGNGAAAPAMPPQR